MHFLNNRDDESVIQTSHGIHSKNQGLNIAILNYANYFEGPIDRELNVKLKN